MIKIDWKQYIRDIKPFGFCYINDYSRPDHVNNYGHIEYEMEWGWSPADAGRIRLPLSVVDFILPWLNRLV